MMRIATILLLLMGGCATTHNVQIAPLEVQPIRVTMDVNVNVHESDTPVGSAGEAEEEDADADEPEAEDAGTRAVREQPARAPQGS